MLSVTIDAGHLEVAGIVVSGQYCLMATSEESGPDVCDVCGSTDLWWRNCKLLCKQCRSIVKSCADL
jgi:hypothetical protein